ncbi:hypothetical protein V493_04864, partial [Pseudogymnoascus sp. VKM F-4281 (FW-2241)]
MPDQNHSPSGKPHPPAPSQDHTNDVVPQKTTTTTNAPSASDEKKQRIRVKNRRKMYLDKHPSYFDSPDLEIVG